MSKFSPLRNSGISLIEVLISLAIGLFILSFGFTALISINKSFVFIKENAKMQETARFAYELILQDVIKSRYWRNMLNFSQFGGSTALHNANSTNCDEGNSDWARQLQQPIFALNNSALDYNCVINDFYLGGDVLTLRYPDIVPVNQFDNEQIYLRTNTARHKVFLGSSKTDSINTNLSIPTYTQLITSHSYFIADTNRTCKGNKVPGLYWQTLRNAKPHKEELLSGVEQLQLTFLVDKNDDGKGDTYLNPNQVINWHKVMAIDVQLLIRSECPDRSFIDTNTYQIADLVYKPNDNFHRQTYHFSFNYQ